ncbi:MAG: PepSY-associated TM helix domain-containing protein [Planctomycetes bacterium]|nr:PepSY-associated TM helix domain-containing protein [Planctomycetota bacterium]MCB9909817.1 PepSY-associated TM helix domain-containing protein [Planctomycetota bacterium]MCB9912273.1 PepSY-associated TM helix domain-containing protein [Planctomycetota bacterium]HPF13514.1 PepSY-associated TM helix domain-containing protein [Planctomycetota bacterium]HRV80689.1 PepSY-associated TM helix domain-containing protein [Planctomycetota bacterium]
MGKPSEPHARQLSSEATADAPQRSNPGSARRRRGVVFWVRWLHLYVSVIGFAALIFFSLTGITLNHADYFESGAEVERTWEGSLSEGLIPSDESQPVDRLALVEALRSEHGLQGAVREFSDEDGIITLVFKGPAYSADVTVDRMDGQAKLYELRLGTWALLDDLHKGRDSGGAWSWVIDASAILLIIAAATGLWLLLYIKKRRSMGLLLTLGGTLVLFLVWAVWVP